jgi:hypothetical protein
MKKNCCAFGVKVGVEGDEGCAEDLEETRLAALDFI